MAKRLTRRCNQNLMKSNLDGRQFKRSDQSDNDFGIVWMDRRCECIHFRINLEQTDKLKHTLWMYQNSWQTKAV